MKLTGWRPTGSSGYAPYPTNNIFLALRLNKALA
jgi:hypothetical protein